MCASVVWMFWNFSHFIDSPDCTSHLWPAGSAVQYRTQRPGLCSWRRHLKGASNQNQDSCHSSRQETRTITRNLFFC